ncbi:MAG: hypothetical protein AAF354_10270 [Pseudomonadota bacterium]
MTTTRTSICSLAAGIAGLLMAPAAVAGTIESVYTPLVLEECENTTPPEIAEHGAVFTCEGHGGLDVRVAEGDLRMYVSYGDGAGSQTAAGQTIPAFNTTGETLEWRLIDGRPFATILRLRWDSDGRKGSTLVVTKLGEADACHVAYVQATENPDANVLAREIADADARRFSCARDRARTYGADGQPIN